MCLYSGVARRLTEPVIQPARSRAVSPTQPVNNTPHERGGQITVRDLRHAEAWRC